MAIKFLVDVSWTNLSEHEPVEKVIKKVLCSNKYNVIEEKEIEIVIGLASGTERLVVKWLHTDMAMKVSLGEVSEDILGALQLTVIEPVLVIGQDLSGRMVFRQS